MVYVEREHPIQIRFTAELRGEILRPIKVPIKPGALRGMLFEEEAVMIYADASNPGGRALVIMCDDPNITRLFMPSIVR